MSDKEKVLDALKRPFCHMVIDINKITNISNNKIRKILEELISEGLVMIVNKNYYIKKTGTIEIKNNGYGFINVPSEEQEYYVDRNDNNGAYTGDIVEFYVLPALKGQRKDNAVVTRVLKHSNEFIYGLLITKKNKHGIKYQIISRNKDFDVKASVLPQDLNGAVDGSIVVGKLDNLDKDPTAVVTKIVGHKDDPGVDISLIALEYGFEASFPDEVMNEASKLDKPVDASLYASRRDFRNDLVITIDGDDSKDFDDAVSVKILANGNYELSVHIADVAEYVKDSSPLDKEAYKRGTSVYLADRVIPMLPHALSNGICSLNEGVDRLTLSCIMELDNEANIISYDITEGIIKSAHRMTYNNVNKIILGDQEVINEYPDLTEMVSLMVSLSKKIRAKREANGALDFDVPEYKIDLNERGEPIKFNLRQRGPAEMLIEDFMLKANEVVAYHLNKLDLPCIYRVHEAPDQEKLENVFKFIDNLGVKVKKSKNGIMPKTIQDAMSKVKEETDSYFVVNQMMLRAMMKAKYSEELIGHYGLALDYYCHFTSPIRRYPDLMVHRIIKTLLLHAGSDFDEKYMRINYDIHEKAYNSSEAERKAIDCEREVDDMLMAIYMQKHIGEVYEGQITSVTQFGMFVTIDGGIEGLVHINNMSGYYVFDDKKMSLSSYNKTFTLGDKITIVVVGASKKDRSVDFMLKDDYYGEDDDFWYGNRYNRN